MSKRTLRDGDESFDVTILESANPARVVLFAVGRGGNPERHLPLLTFFAEHDCTVVAPHFEHLVSYIPTADHLHMRARRLRLALDSVARSDLPVAGIGHSIGATMLLVLGGGRAYTHSRHLVSVLPDNRLERIVLLAPATDFFLPPNMLDDVRLPLMLWVGTKDEFTTPARAELLKQAIGDRAFMDIRIVEGAGHFTFMDVQPPQSTEPHPNRVAFLEEMRAEIFKFVFGKSPQGASRDA